jgi:hypothetical protein
VLLLLYSESLGFITLVEVLALAPDVSEGGASKRARTAEGSNPLDFFGSSLNYSTGYRLDSSSCTGTWTGRTSFCSSQIAFSLKKSIIHSPTIFPLLEQFTAES